MQVKQLADETGVPAHVIRYYTQIGLLTPDRDPNNRYREYVQSDVNRVRFIHRAKWLGLSLNDVRSILHDVDNGTSPNPDLRHLIKARVRQNRKRLDVFDRLQARMESVVEEWNDTSDELLSHDSLCHLMDAVAAENGGRTTTTGME